MTEQAKKIGIVALCCGAIAVGGVLVVRGVGSGRSGRAETALEGMLRGSSTEELLHRRQVMSREIEDAMGRNPDSDLLAGARRGLADIDAELERRGVDPATATADAGVPRSDR